jgi:ectoine hydroxylase
MRLSDEQLRRWNEDGYLFFERLFSPDEIETIRRHLFDASLASTPGVKREEGSASISSMMGVHLYDAVCEQLTRHPRLLEPALQIAGEELALLQSRVIVKTPAETIPHRTFPWHQDFSTWHTQDAMPEPRAIVVGVFLDDVTACNSPVMIVPKSHRGGMIGRREDGAYEQILIDAPIVAELVAEGGLEAMIGPAGSAFFMHANAVHASHENITPLRRTIFYVIYNPVTNRCVSTRGIWWIPDQWLPLAPAADDCLRAV